MLPVSASVLVFLVAGTIDGPPAVTESPRASEVSVSVVSGTAPVLPGLELGVTVEGQRQPWRAPVFLAARLQWSDASSANQSWIIDQQQFVAAASLGLTTTVGVARLWIQAGGGASAIYEVLSKHPVDQGTGIAGETATAFTVGPYAFGEAGVALVLRGRVRAFVAAGPTEARTIVYGVGQWRFGAFGRMGVAYDF